MAEQKSNIDKKARKRRVAIIVAVLCLAAVVGMFFLNSDLKFDFSFSGSSTPDETVQHVYDGSGQHRLSLYDPDWESDIFTNEKWLDKNRYISYAENGMQVMLIDGDFSAYGEPVELLADYCDALMHGDAERLNGFYSDDYFSTHDRFERITMQKLYDIVIEFLSEEDVTENGKIVSKYTYKLTYKIMENDGTFRNDLISDGEKPQFYTIIDDGAKLLITDVKNYYDVQ